MPSPNEKLAESLDVLEALQQGNRRCSFRRPEPGSPRTPGGERLPARSHEGLADLFKPRHRGRREHPVARVVLGILRTLLRRRFGEHGTCRRSSPFFCTAKNGDPGSTVVHSPKAMNNDISSVRNNALRPESRGDARDRTLTVRDGLRLFSPRRRW